MATLSKRIGANLFAARQRPRGVVISLRKEIAEALADGFQLIEIWQQLQLEGTFKPGYDRFRRLVRRYVTQPSTANRQSRSRAAKAPATPAPNGFAYNPKPNPEDLF